MAKFRPYRLSSSKLNNLPRTDGNFIVTTDNKKIFIDTPNDRICLNDTATDNTKLPLAGGTLTGDVAIPFTKSTKDGSIPYAGSNLSNTPIKLTEFLPNCKTIIGAINTDITNNSWQDIISIRHRNGNGDGINFGMYIRTNLTTKGDLIWNQQTQPNYWVGERTILDSGNYTNYHDSTKLSLTGGTMTGTLINNSIDVAKPILQSDDNDSWINAAKGAAAYYNTSNVSNHGFACLASMPSTNGRFVTGSYKDCLVTGYMSNDTISKGTNILDKTLMTHLENGNTEFCGKVIALGGTKVRTFANGAGSNGYMYICRLKVKSSYVNQPIIFDFVQRYGHGRVLCQFDQANNVDPAFAVYIDGGCKVYYNKVEAGTWDIYIKKSEAYDNIEITNLQKGDYMANVDLTWMNETVAELPTGYKEAGVLQKYLNILGNAATATKLKTARTINGVSFDGSANITIPVNETILYNNSSGTTGTITLSQAVENFREIEVWYTNGTNKDNTGWCVAKGLVNFVTTSILLDGTKIVNPNNEATATYTQTVKQVYCTGTTLTSTNYNQGAWTWLGNEFLSFGQYSQITIYKVVGYK